MNKMNDNAPQIVRRVTLPAAQEPSLLAQQADDKQNDQGVPLANLSWEITL